VSKSVQIVYQDRFFIRLFILAKAFVNEMLRIFTAFSGVITGV
jgi:hypothetical protein